jgi:hypothetical protein
LDDTTISNPDYFGRLGPERLILQVETLLKNGRGGCPDITLRTSIDALRSKLYDAHLGGYLFSYMLDDPANGADGYFAADPMRGFPGLGLPGCFHTLAQMCAWRSGPNKGQYIRPWRVDISRQANANQLCNAILEEFERRRDVYGLRVAKTDEWLCSLWAAQGNDYPIDFPAMMSFFDMVNGGLQQLGILHAANCSYWFGAAIADADILRVAKADALICEGATNPDYLSDATKLTEWLRRMNLVISAGCTPILLANVAWTSPGTWPDGYINDDRFLAGLAMVLDKPLISYPIYFPRFEWLEWPKQYGAPTGPLVQNGTILTRTFDNGTITVDCVARTAA